MGARRLLFLLLLYVTLDFANPLMPGAVRFDGRGLETVPADRARPSSLIASIDLVATSEKIADRAVRRVRASSQSDPITEPRRRAVVRIRRTLASSSDPAVASEDH
jgi:hypothetical protein